MIVKRFSVKKIRLFLDGYPEWGIFCEGKRIACLTRSEVTDEILVSFVDKDFDPCNVYFRHGAPAYELKALLKAIAATC